MADSVVQICNMALSNLGAGRFIEDIDDDTVEAELCDLWFWPSVYEALESADWPWAQARAVLSELDLTRSGWGYVYSLPADCLVPREVYVSTDEDDGRNRNPNAAVTIPFSVEQDGEVKVLVTDIEDAALRYTVRLATVGIFPQKFTLALSWLLASHMAMPLTKDRTIENQCFQKFMVEVNNAMALAGHSAQPDRAPDSEIITVRG